MTPDRIDQLESVYMSIVENIATMSLATRKKVGAIIVKDNNIISYGWNGLPSGMDNTLIEKDNVTNPLVIHAEANAILKCAKTGSATEGATLYCTLSPCIECTKLIIQAGIKKVVHLENYRDTDGIEVLKQNNLEIKYGKKTYSGNDC